MLVRSARARLIPEGRAFGRAAMRPAAAPLAMKPAAAPPVVEPAAAPPARPTSEKF